MAKSGNVWFSPAVPEHNSWNSKGKQRRRSGPAEETVVEALVIEKQISAPKQKHKEGFTNSWCSPVQERKMMADVMKSETKKREQNKKNHFILYKHLSLINTFKVVFICVFFIYIYEHQTLSVPRCVRLCPRHHSVSSFTLFASYLFVFVCMRLGMIRLFIDVCVAVKPKMHGPSPRHLVHIIACEFKVRLFLLRDCVRDCPCSPSLPCNLQRWEICCLKRVQLSLLSSLFPSVHPSCRPSLLTLHSFCIVVLLFALQVKKSRMRIVRWPGELTRLQNKNKYLNRAVGICVTSRLRSSWVHVLTTSNIRSKPPKLIIAVAVGGLSKQTCVPVTWLAVCLLL